jgi:hypothetical protein
LPCGVHSDCGIEPESGKHHGGIIRLSFDRTDLPRGTRT